ncbi:hypothetical protein Goarm_015466 [Gossypium armourianum]|uniref:Uncharacterized protein n=1 Tax=Gossypium armourianum TaxID=34283 RepID=A0A7J9JA53_9ROSI|nr:hypothetical protein [Gossypium armourianum]
MLSVTLLGSTSSLLRSWKISFLLPTIVMCHTSTVLITN